jgi:hypothetical protein
MRPAFIRIVLLLLAPLAVRADVGDPQVRTEHPWYPGELACSTFDRLFATQAKAFHDVIGRSPVSDEDRALASWLWRNTHYAHAEAAGECLWTSEFAGGLDPIGREYWTGLFSHGFGLCGTTHAQWIVEMEALLGHARARVVGVRGHNAFEVWLTGGAYGSGRWALLDHDISTVVFAPDGSRLLSIAEVRDDLKRLTDPTFHPERQRGWPLGGLHPDDPLAYADQTTAEYLAGYSGPPPMVHLRRGERYRRYLAPGLDDGRLFAFWGRNYNTGGIPGPERSRTWVNQPEKFRGTPGGSGFRPGQARYGNAVFQYQPDFRSGDYREGVVREGPDHVVFEFQSPYVIATTPPDDSPWGVYQPGGRNGLVISGQADVEVAVSVDGGSTWHNAGPLRDPLDLTDLVKGRRQYLLRLAAGAASLADSGLTITTVCQANPATMPHLEHGANRVVFAASNRAVMSVGPQVERVSPHVVEGELNAPRVTLEVASPRGEPVQAIHAAGHVFSSNPPDPRIAYHIECSTDGGRSWWPMVANWRIERRGDEPRDFWSQSFCWGSAQRKNAAEGPVRVRFRNDGGKRYARVEAHLVYNTGAADPTRVTFAWTDDQGPREASHTFTDGGSWDLEVGRDVVTRWVEFEPIPVRR